MAVYVNYLLVQIIVILIVFNHSNYELGEIEQYHNITIRQLPFIVYVPRKYTLFVQNSTFLPYLENEQLLMRDILQSQDYINSICESIHSVISFFNSSKNSLLHECKDNRPLSHCQPFYLFQIDFYTSQCQGYKRQLYHRTIYNGVTLTVHLSTNRLDRLPFHLSRWDEAMSISIQLNENELEEVLLTVFKYQRHNIIYTLYVIPQDAICYYNSLSGEQVNHTSCYDVNILRNLAIETIRTSHFIIVDGDGIISKTLQSNYKEFIDFLYQDNNVILFPTISYRDPNDDACNIEGNCTEIWKSIPSHKGELVKIPKQFISIKRGYYIVEFSKWKQIFSNHLLKLKPTHFMEPYGIFRRSRKLPLFHPYFYNYGRNKEEFYRVLNTMRFNYRVLSLDFAIDLPHPRSEYDKEVRKKSSNKLSVEYITYFDTMYKTYCNSKNVCSFHSLFHFVRTSMRVEYLPLACCACIMCCILFNAIQKLAQFQITRNNDSSRFRLFTTSNLIPKQDGSLALVIQTSSMDSKLNSFINTIYTVRNNTVVYVLSEDHTFDLYSTLWESKQNSSARIVHCDPKLCDSLVYSFLAYEDKDFVGILRWQQILSADSDEKSVFLSQFLADISLPLGPSDPIIIYREIQRNPFFSLFTSSIFRNMISHPCFTTEYKRFNSIEKLKNFNEKVDLHNCTRRTDNNYNSQSAVILTIFKRNYLSEILPLICNQTQPPSLLLFIQNSAYQSLNRSIIPKICTSQGISIYHIWLSNWNSFSFMRHYVPIPSSIHTTILVDDDMFLVPTAFETGMNYLHSYHCIATERGRMIDMHSINHEKWTLIIGKEVKKLTYVDYAFIPLFLDTEWRKAVWKVEPFSRVYGDILFISIAIYQDRHILPCVIPDYEFFLRNEDKDIHSTSKKNHHLYNYYYHDIASQWIDSGYVPILQRDSV